jgi:hypothetical protein
MKVKIQNIFSLIIAVFVLFLSMGINISKMACDKESNIYFGVQEFSCSIEEKSICKTSKQDVSCCSAVVEKTCCPDKSDNNCKTNSSLIQFNFETVFESLYDYDFLSSYILRHNYSNIINTYIEKIYRQTNFLLLNINKPTLPKIQTFLI